MFLWLISCVWIVFCSDRFYQMKGCPDTYYIVVIEDTVTNQVVGSGSLIKEQKFIHSATSVRLCLTQFLNPPLSCAVLCVCMCVLFLERRRGGCTKDCNQEWVHKRERYKQTKKMTKKKENKKNKTLQVLEYWNADLWVHIWSASRKDSLRGFVHLLVFIIFVLFC